MTFTTIGYEIRDGVAQLTLNRPDKMNAINATLHDELQTALAQASGDSTVRVLLVTGAGDRAFCAGLDLHARGEDSAMDPGRLQERSIHPERTLVARFVGFEKPLVAAVNGAATGAGLAFALSADIVLAADTARFGTAHVHLGLPVLDMLGYLLPRRVSAGAAAEMAFTGRLVGADEALRIGLADRVLPLDRLKMEASALCAAIAAQAPLSLRFSKLALRRAGRDSYEDYARFERYIFGVAYGSEDAKEAIRARREKRAPQFKGF